MAIPFASATSLIHFRVEFEIALLEHVLLTDLTSNSPSQWLTVTISVHVSQSLTCFRHKCQPCVQFPTNVLSSFQRQ